MKFRSSRNRHMLVTVGVLTLLMVHESCLFDTETYLCASGRRCKDGQVCAQNQDICIDVDGCGDGVTRHDRDEVCDDGNVLDGDGCSADCTSDETCGNDIIDMAVGETCDDGNAIAGDGCSSTCRLESCGNGRLDPGEVCDDGNMASGDGCKDDCTSNEICGNGIVDAHLDEQCDLGEFPPINTADCDADCTMPECGDDYLNRMAGEECDTAGDSEICDEDCTIIMCGDGYINMSVEFCDPGPDMVGISTPTCDADCTVAECGDQFFNPEFVVDDDYPEECDDGGDSAICDGDCTIAECGDAYVNPFFLIEPDNGAQPYLEICDDGGNTASCDADCTLPICGDGYINQAASETCEPSTDAMGNPLNGPNCDSNCTDAECGDGHFNPEHEVGSGGSAYNEQCDDGNTIEEDACIDCKEASCGDGYLWIGMEVCDDGNQDNEDDCPDGPNGTCKPAYCGDGFVNRQGSVTEGCESDSDCGSGGQCNRPGTENECTCF